MTIQTTFRAALLGMALTLPMAAFAQPGGAPAQQRGATPNADWHRTVDDALGKPGAEKPGGVWRVALPRTDLKVTLDGVQIQPGFALGSWLAFHPHGQELMVMGDLVLLETRSRR